MRAVNLYGATWIDGHKECSFESSNPGFGVVDDDGRALASDGHTPSVWRTMWAAKQVAEHPPADWPRVAVTLRTGGF